MNLPNKLTMIRIILVPVMMIIYLFKDSIGNVTYLIMGIIFVIASFTDYLDGKIARQRNIVTTFGKFIDPLADKLLVMAALLILADNFRVEPSMWMPFWVPIIILAREFIVTSIRLVAVGGGKIIAASNLGKYKTALTMVTITYYLFVLPFVTIKAFDIIGIVLVIMSVGMTLISGLDYFMKNKSIILESI
ncbi:MAG: CDP-diacylglycerol--glycerol-3-phosphate 3-phosphatidyltransferase [Firmicutes bacterium]|nr:CDP-diacylglycerol--glycerol-3-phosphate 3-phosphatidyltransferase [Bacillota bacterium]